ncbi:transporter, major facilitator superfamily protein [Acanthamoeba castellanii str. Neff]|uniref:Transporter, major facilitator superfamily protein n=1 Tax=Acanthamoeba castellanii (strain ATCC 30010 / Neff) TaxID=1257118 RepID=L8GVT5_ACACF|nr:transporter, major facilitator superfamily protein [Acanthamoeba castellanii str. Neff]ELR17354.1 transporter, major facilitator superfamily protein [Acanthamoeba castellanii str. Neff]
MDDLTSRSGGRGLGSPKNMAYSPVLSSVDPADDGALGAPKEADLEFATVEFNNVEEKEDEDEPRRGRKQNIAKIDETRHRAGAVSGTYEEEFDQDKDLPDFNPLRQRGTVGSRGWIDRWAMVAGVVGFAAVGGFLFGYDTGVVGGAILLIQEQFDLSSLLVETVISIALVGAIIGSASGGLLSDSLGRRKAPDVTTLILGRFIVGLAIGVAAIVSPVYLAEISPTRYRGAVVTVNNLCLTGGQFVSYLVDSAFVSVPGGWRWMLGLGAVPAAVQLVGVVMWLPESPRWLIGRYMAVRDQDPQDLPMGDMTSSSASLETRPDFFGEDGAEWRERLDRAEWERQQARSILRRLRGGGHAYEEEQVEREIEGEIEEIEDSLRQQSQTSLADKWRMLSTKPVRSALVVAAMYYSPTILKMAGFESHESAIWFADIIAFSNAFFTGVALFLMDRAGRRTLLLVSLSGVVAALVMLGIAFFGDRTHTGYTAVASLVVYVAFFALGMGPIPWVVNSEIYPADVRGLANGLAATVNWSANLLVSSTFLTYIDLVGTTLVFWTFAGVGVAAWLFVFFKLPETKGVPIEHIQQLFVSGDRFVEQPPARKDATLPTV